MLVECTYDDDGGGGGGGVRRAIRGLSNYMFFEAQRLAKEEVQEGNDKFDG